MTEHSKSTMDVLEEIDRLAEAGACQMGMGGKHAFLTDIRALVAKHLHTAPAPEPSYPLPDGLYDSKDWRQGNYASRVEWLRTMYDNTKATLDLYLGQLEPKAEPDMRHPKVQSVLAAKSRLSCEIGLIEDILEAEDPNDVSTGLVEHWGPLHDKVLALRKAEPVKASGEVAAWRDHAESLVRVSMAGAYLAPPPGPGPERLREIVSALMDTIQRNMNEALAATPQPEPQAEPVVSRGAVGMGANALAGELAAAALADDSDPEGHDISAGLFGPAVSSWLRKVARDYLTNKAEPVRVPGEAPCVHETSGKTADEL